jgi:hypothetical protein
MPRGSESSGWARWPRQLHAGGRAVINSSDLWRLQMHAREIAMDAFISLSTQR